MNKKAPRHKKSPLLPISIIRFHRKTLPFREKAALFTLLLIMVLSGILSLLSPLNWIWLISLLSFSIGLFQFYSGFIDKPNFLVFESQEIKDLCKFLKPSEYEEKCGYENTWIPKRNDSIIMSQSVNYYLRYNAEKIELKLVLEKARKLLDSLGNSSIFRDILVHQYFEARKHEKKFFNDPKISLLSSITPETTSIDVFESCYYLSFLTNDLATYDVEDHSHKSQPKNIWLAVEHFPYHNINHDCDNSSQAQKGFIAKALGFNINVQSRTKKASQDHEDNQSVLGRIKDLRGSNMSNHIGGNTIAFTKDKRMILWRQNESAMRSVGLLAPTGSGSLDFSDYTELSTKNLFALAVRGMERELLEECHPGGSKISNFIDSTKVVGFYRWVGKAGLPGFLGISKINAMQSEVIPNSSEVNIPPKLKTDYPAENMEQLKKTIEELLEKQFKSRSEKESNLSVPLVANLLAIKGVIERDPEFLDFIFK